jgi:hypothetical protein
MASEIKLIAQPRNGSGNPTTFDYKPGGKHPAEAGNFYKISVDGKEELPVGTKIVRKGNSIVFEFPDGTNFTIEEWCSVSDSRLTELVNGEAYSANDAKYVTAKDIDSGTCVIWADAGQAGAVLGDSSVAPVTTATAPPAAGDDHATAGIIAAILGVGALAAAASSSGGGGGDPPDNAAPAAGTPDALNEDFAPTTITAAAIKASDDRGVNQIQIVSAKIKSADGFNFSDDNDPTNDDVQIVAGKDGPVLQLTESGANKFGTVTTTIELRDAAGNVSTQDVVFTVNPVNDAPENQVATPAGPISSFTETLGRSPNLVLFAGLNLSVSDIDDATGLDGFKIGTVTLDLTDGTLAVTTPGNVVVSGDAKHLVLTGSQQDINLALESILWSNDPANTDTRDVNITMTTADSGGETDVDVIQIILNKNFGASTGGNGGGFPAAASQSSALTSLIGNLDEQIPPSA